MKAQIISQSVSLGDYTIDMDGRKYFLQPTKCLSEFSCLTDDGRASINIQINSERVFASDSDFDIEVLIKETPKPKPKPESITIILR